MIKKAFLAGGIIMLLFACTSTEKLVSDTTKDRIFFGKSGGFTNISMEYVLIDSKHLFKIEGEKYVKVRKLNGSQVKSLDNLMTAIAFDQLMLDEPGNITYHIKVIRSGSEKEVKWSDSTDNAQIKELYKAFLSTIKE
jgi:hypothetical protein